MDSILQQSAIWLTSRNIPFVAQPVPYRIPFIPHRNRVPYYRHLKLCCFNGILVVRYSCIQVGLLLTSRKISFFRCLIPSLLQDTALVKATGGRGAASNRFPSCNNMNMNMNMNTN